MWIMRIILAYIDSAGWKRWIIATKHFILFICCLFNAAVNSLHVEWLGIMNSEGSGMLRLWPASNYCIAICSKGLSKTTETSVKVSVPTEIRTEYFLNVDQLGYRLNQFVECS
jgi:hypothetical protein